MLLRNRPDLGNDLLGELPQRLAARNANAGLDLSARWLDITLCRDRRREQARCQRGRRERGRAGQLICSALLPIGADRATRDPPAASATDRGSSSARGAGCACRA
jgi:hypothetical protein